ncbi:MAG: hypothetical protein IT385_14365 [Deltaproteobacteria bacterium]|nr:hypothetical protein [Deltaproteobacteria bacterium]
MRRLPSLVLAALLSAGCDVQLDDPAVARGASSFEDGTTVLEDQPTLDLMFVEEEGALGLDLWLDEAWEPMSGAIVDLISRDSGITSVKARFRTTAEAELRMRFRAASGGWGPWTAWTRSAIERRVSVPQPGHEAALDFEAEQRTSATFVGWVCHPTGCIKIKKLNSGG